MSATKRPSPVQRLRRLSLAVVSAAALSSVAVIPVTAVEPETCDLASVASWTIESAPDTELRDKFATYGNLPNNWNGGDSTYSTVLPDGRTAWFFSDTLFGVVNEDGSQPLDTEFVNSSMVIEENGELTRTVTGGNAANRTGLIPPDENGWYWLGASHVTDDGSSLDVMFMRFERFGPGMWDWGWDRNVLGRFSPRSLKLQEVVPMPSESGVNWASWIQRVGGETLIYGVEDLGLEKFMHLAKVPGDDLTEPWQYWTGTGWSPTETDSVRIMPGVANEYSVAPFHDGYLLVTQNTLELFSRDIVAYTSCSPTGPFTRIGTLYTTPETGLFGSYGNPNVFTYNAHEHPDRRDGNDLLVTYNVNSFDPNDLYADATIYRPRFIGVSLIPTP
jgi:hypothetical protein